MSLKAPKVVIILSLYLTEPKKKKKVTILSHLWKHSSFFYLISHKSDTLDCFDVLLPWLGINRREKLK